MLPPPPIPDTVDAAGNPVYFDDGTGAPAAPPAQSGANPVYVPAGLARGPDRGGGGMPPLYRPPPAVGARWGKMRAQFSNPAVAGFLGGLAAWAAIAAVKAIARSARRGA